MVQYYITIPDGVIEVLHNNENKPLNFIMIGNIFNDNLGGVQRNHGLFYNENNS